MAAALKIVKQLQSALTCSICNQSFLNPSTLNCGHNFCYNCILSYMNECGPGAACPRCQEEITRMGLPLNRQLENIVKLAGELADRVRRPAGWQRRCKEHPEALQSFCLDDLVLFCSACDTSQERQPHRVLPALEAAQAYKYYFKACARNLKQEKEKIDKNNSTEDTEYFKLLKRMSEEKNAVAAELEALQDFVAMQENFLLVQVMEKAEKEIARCKAVQEARLLREESEFDGIIRELREKDNEPPLEFLRDITGPMARSWRRFRGFQAFPVELKMYLWDMFDFSVYLQAVAKQYKAPHAWTGPSRESLGLAFRIMAVFLIVSESRSERGASARRSLLSCCCSDIKNEGRLPICGKGHPEPTQIFGRMSSADSLEKMLHMEVTCYLCINYFINPVTLDCGHNFCHACILRSWGQFSVVTACPRCQQTVLRENLRPNDQLADVARLIRQMKDVAKQAAGEAKLCEEHEKDATVFCTDELVTFCQNCAEARDHQQHDVVSLEEAARNRIKNLRKLEDEIVEHEREMGRQWDDLIQQIRAEKEKIAEGFSKVHQLMEEHSSKWSSWIEEGLEEIEEKRREHMAELSNGRYLIKEIIWELDWKCDQVPFDVLQDIGSTLGRCMKEVPVKQGAFPPGLRGDLWEMQKFNAFLPGAVKQFEENAEFSPGTDQPKRIKLGDVSQSSSQESEEEDLTEFVPCARPAEESTAGGH
ncbi:hypothetical protein JRQ81_003512 [Phrynocephalus forsythii]|uniref:Uncharacterized protein n=1 Tax=Phrynocephalus forsythii TaxID=171643 RepID=A0A9Q0XLV5_9SAUR|nr:hypothetical protein JRQ81_003512 [Phrynocephalus forsythii]